jgi:NAD-dependent deacetylase
MSDIHSDARKLYELIQEADEVVALTGAGISTEAGIPDFRSPGGLWERFDPIESFSIDGFRRNPKILYEVGQSLTREITSAQPTSAHQLLVELEKSKKLTTVITQNIDGLHQRAGSRHVLEVHGSMASSTCLECGAGYKLKEVDAIMEKHPLPPLCTRCGGLLKPDVVLFGEQLPQDVFSEAMSAATRADIMLVVGSSLVVSPASELPALTLRNHGKLVIMNLQNTWYDPRATLVLQYRLKDICAEILGLMS